MFWIVVLFVAGLAGVAYGWIEVRKSPERVTISLELAKMTPAIRGAKAAVLSLCHGSKSYRERHGQHSRS